MIQEVHPSAGLTHIVGERFEDNWRKYCDLVPPDERPLDHPLWPAFVQFVAETPGFDKRMTEPTAFANHGLQIWKAFLGGSLSANPVSSSHVQ